MAKHCAALPGAANELLGSSTAELATALLQRLGEGITPPREGPSRRHAAPLHAPPSYAPQQRTRRPGMPTRMPGRPALAAMSVTAVGAVAAIAATGQFAAVAPASASMSLNDPTSTTSTFPAVGHPSAPVAPAAAAAAAAAAPAASPLAADLQPVKVSSIVDSATSAAKVLAAKESTIRAAALTVPAHVPVPVPDVPAPTISKATGAAGAALSAAMSKLGVPYVWGASGPTAFDCSGLVQWSFKQAGISLPRTASAQSTVGEAVSKSQLQPGDLVFFYTPVSHVGIYIGDGKVVNATQSGEPVQISNIAYMPFHNARRI
ncbi:MAG: peptidoglycan DL-endopeptidase CwlO [Pseudonocardiales bacterium]|jgi:cell wall-associated NlpC family hydrolase|nr:peptidoglycan DL-endopeptidase CwlO [Pseudonocardiales bacterium]